MGSSLGESMYYDEVNKRWVMRGKENESTTQSAGPPPIFTAPTSTSGKSESIGPNPTAMDDNDPMAALMAPAPLRGVPPSSGSNVYSAFGGQTAPPGAPVMDENDPMAALLAPRAIGAPPPVSSGFPPGSNSSAMEGSIPSTGSGGGGPPSMPKVWAPPKPSH